jgi:hypothetical protein
MGIPFRCIRLRVLRPAGSVCASVLREVAVATAGSLLLASVSAAQSWPQWALNPQQTGNVNVAGQPLNSILANIVYDPLVPQEMAANQARWSLVS